MQKSVTEWVMVKCLQWLSKWTALNYVLWGLLSCVCTYMRHYGRGLRRWHVSYKCVGALALSELEPQLYYMETRAGCAVNNLILLEQWFTQCRRHNDITDAMCILAPGTLCWALSSTAWRGQCLITIQERTDRTQSSHTQRFDLVFFPSIIPAVVLFSVGL